jgi:hypothetical protein
VIALHQDLGLDDRDGVSLLAECRIAAKRMGVGGDAVTARTAIPDRDRRPPLGKARSELVIFAETLAQSVEALGDLGVVISS